MAIQEQILTVEEFWELCQQPEYANKQLELVDGRLVVMTPSSGMNAGIALAIGHYIYQFVKENDLGQATGADGGYVLYPDTVRVPDAAFIAKERIPDGEFVFYPTAPDLAVEVISPSETASTVTFKNREYLEAGTRIVWNVYPKEKVVDVVTLADDGALISHQKTISDTLDGGEVLPGFSVPVAAIFS